MHQLLVPRIKIEFLVKGKVVVDFLHTAGSRGEENLAKQWNKVVRRVTPIVCIPRMDEKITLLYVLTILYAVGGEVLGLCACTTNWMNWYIGEFLSWPFLIELSIGSFVANTF